MAFLKSKFSHFPWRALFVTILICAAGNLQRSYQQAIINPTEELFKKFINESSHVHYGRFLSNTVYNVVWAFLVNATFFGCIAGSLLLRFLSDKLGRRRLFYITSSSILSGLVLEALSKLANSFEMFASGRLMVGFGIGLSSSLEGVYLNEISPRKSRGLFTSMTGVASQLGYVIAALIGLQDLLGTERLWPWMFVVAMCPVVLLLLAIHFIPESPRYLFAKGRRDKCKNALFWFGHENIDESMRESESEVKQQRERLKWGEIWTRPYYRKATLLCVVVMFMSGMNGAVYINYFCTSILKRVGVPERNAQYSTLGILAMFLLSTILGIFLIDKVGRRPLLLSSIFGMTMCNISMMIFGLIYNHGHYTWAGYARVATCVLFAFSAGGNIVVTWSITPELVPVNARLPVQTIAITTFQTVTLIAGLVFYPLYGAIGEYSFLMFIVSLTICFIVLAKEFTETKKKTVEDVMKSMGYNCDESDKE